MITGKKLRITGKGGSSPYGGPPGDLFIQAKVVPDPVFTADKYDLHITRNIKLSAAILGARIDIPLLNSGELCLKIPPGTKHKTKMRLSGHGLPHMKGSGKGDLYVLIHVDMPKKLTDEQRNLVEKLAAMGM
jgi:curved DNA-binding protein